MLRSSEYCSCLLRHVTASTVPCPGNSSSHSDVTDKTSNNVPYASKASACIAGHCRIRRMRTVTFAVVVLGSVTLLLAVPRASSGAQPCESLASLKMPDTTITAASVVPAGPFVANPGAVAGGRGGAPPTVPAFCRVQLTIAPRIGVEVWMPASGWNGKFEAVGGGGYAGALSYPAMVTALNAGYATASTDTGHVGGDGRFALGHSELV